MKTRILLLFAIAGLLFGQQTVQVTPPHPAFIVYQSATGAAAVVTVQLPANTAGTAGLHFIGAFVTCSGGCNVIQELQGSAATATAFTPIPLRDRRDVSIAQAFTASNSSAPASTIPGVPVQASIAQSLDLSMIRMQSGRNYNQVFTLRTDNAAGTNAIALIYEEAP